MFNSIFVILGAALWATDTIFRHPMTQKISATTIVFLEHGFAVLVSGIWLFLVQRKKMNLELLPLAGSALVGVLGSALATVFFTMSFQFVNPTVSILLQKIQPIVVILFSWVFLGEKLPFRFFGWALVAIIAAFGVSFPSGIRSEELVESQLSGVILALAAAFFWAVSTVIGKLSLKKLTGSELTWWRFLFGFLTLWAMVHWIPQSRIEVPLVTADSSIMLSIFFMALVPGFMGVALYYRGLTRVKASVATILELSFPLCAMFVNSRILDLPITSVQLVAALILLVAITQIKR